jgi:hypothetical protein
MLSKTDLRTAVQTEDVRQACAILALVHEAIMSTDRVSLDVLEAVRDEFARAAEKRGGGPRSALKRAWQEYVQQKIDDYPLRATPLQMYEKLYDKHTAT